jgi:hypothetical protein
MSVVTNTATLNRCYRRPLSTSGDKVRLEETEVLPLPVSEPSVRTICLNTANVSTLWGFKCSLRPNYKKWGLILSMGTDLSLLHGVQIGSGAHLVEYPVGSRRISTTVEWRSPTSSGKVKNT